MLCDVCHAKPAKVFLTEIVNGQKREQHLCEDCAQENPILQFKDKLGKDLSISDILSGILSNYAKNLAPANAKDVVCERCGMSLSQMIAKGRLGCPECYNAFAEVIDKNLKTVQGAIAHQGKEPMNAVKLPYEPRSLDSDIVSKNDRKNEEEAGVIEADAIVKNTARGKGAGRKPRKQADGKASVKSEIEKLRTEMKAAADKEEYALAAKLRDRIHAMEEERTDEA